MQTEPEFVHASYVLGQIAYSQGDLDLAIKSYERVVKLAPGSRAIYQQLEAWKKEAALHDTFAARPTARFTVMFEGPEQQAIATRVSAALEAAYARVGKTLNTYPVGHGHRNPLYAAAVPRHHESRRRGRRRPTTGASGFR